jgi:hypothetical protein
MLACGRRDIQHNDTQPKGIQHFDTQKRAVPLQQLA